MKRHRQASGVALDGPLAPERRQHNLIEPVPMVIADTAGRPSRPYRVVDTLAIMERRGSITAEMRQAGEDFRRRFAIAQLDPLRALDLSQMSLGDKPAPRGDHAPGMRVEAARTAVWRAVGAVGGMTSPAGSCLWHVVGWERSVNECAGTGLGGAAGLPGSGVGDSDRCARRAGSSLPLIHVTHIAIL